MSNKHLVPSRRAHNRQLERGAHGRRAQFAQERVSPRPSLRAGRTNTLAQCQRAKRPKICTEHCVLTVVFFKVPSICGQCRCINKSGEARYPAIKITKCGETRYRSKHSNFPFGLWDPFPCIFLCVTPHEKFT